MSSGSEAENMIPMKRKNYDLQFKLEVVAYAEKYNKSKAAKDKKVSRSCIKDWMAQKAQLKAQLISSPCSSSGKRLQGAGRPLKDKDFDEKLINWVRQQRQKKLRVSRTMIQKEALTFSVDKNFKASNGWLEKFLLRHNLVSRRPTTTCQKEPVEYAEKIVSYLLYVEQRRRTSIYKWIFAADETAIYLDYSSSLTVEEKGAQEVPVKTAGHDKLHVTVMLTARSDGFKCRPYILLKNKRPIKEIVTMFKNKLHLCWAGRSFFNDELTSEYLQIIIGSAMFGKRLLAWDSYRCHISDATKKQLKKLQIDTAVIPGGCTKFIQAPDVYWNGPFKAKVRQFYENWMLHGEKSYTKSGNMRAPSMEVYLMWIVDAWDQLPKNLIINSFKGCGLSNALDGSEDYKIHCFKSDSSIPSGQELLQQARAKADISTDEPTQQLNIDDEGVENVGECYNSDVSLDFQCD